jgi:hypothetical protein
MIPDELRQRALKFAGVKLTAASRLVRDTSRFFAIDRGDLLDLDGCLHVVCGNEHEGRFGIDDQPKYWVKRTTSLETGARHIVKMVFQESLSTNVGGRQFDCERSASKEAQVLDVVASHPHFMHGKGVLDAAGNRAGA